MSFKTFTLVDPKSVESETSILRSDFELFRNLGK
jgi:hypothetical protein